MARADTVTLIPLDVAAQILGADNFHFNGIVTLQHPENNAEDDIWFQYPWQKIGQAGRDDFALSLRQAEDLVAEYLGFSLIPIWTEDEEIVVTKPYNPAHRNFRSRNSRGQQKSVITNWKWIIEGGVRAKLLIEAASAITYSDDNGDGYAELATVSVATTATEPQEIHVYFPGESGADEWEIRPITVTISAGTATITFKKWQVPNPELWERSPSSDDPTYRAIDGDNINNFITTVDVYRVYNDPSDQAVFYNEDGCSSCGGSGCTVCGFTTRTGCLRVRNSELGIFSYQPATWDEDEEAFIYSDPSCCTDPDKVIINYRHGLINQHVKTPYLRMEPMWERQIVYYAYSRLDRAGARSENTHNIWNYLTEDLAKNTKDRSYMLSATDVSNPLGTSRAAIQLWRMIWQYKTE